MKLKKNLQEILADLKINDHFKENIVTWKTLEAKEAQTVSLPDNLHSALTEALKSKGIENLYTHQKTAYEEIMAGNSVVAVRLLLLGKHFVITFQFYKAFCQTRVQGRYICFQQKL